MKNIKTKTPIILFSFITNINNYRIKYFTNKYSFTRFIFLFIYLTKNDFEIHDFKPVLLLIILNLYFI